MVTLGLKGYGFCDKGSGGGRFKIDLGVEGDLRPREEESPARNRDFADMKVVRNRGCFYGLVKLVNALASKELEGNEIC